MDELLVRERIADILMVLSSITAGSPGERLPPTEDADDPFSVLYEGINEVVERLLAGQARLALYQRDLEARLHTIEQQRSAIRELSTPVIEVWERVLCLPIVGVMDTVRSAEMTESLLRAVLEKKARYAVVDVTGIEVMDSRTTDHFIRMAKAVRLLGAECVLAGVSPTIAQTIVQMGIDLSGIVTFRSMRDALRHHIRLLASGSTANGSSREGEADGGSAWQGELPR